MERTNWARCGRHRIDLGRYLGKDYIRIGSFVLAFLICVGAVYFLKRRRRLQKKLVIAAKIDGLSQPQSAFRSLAPFDDSDMLPGKIRRVEARSICTRIA